MYSQTIREIIDSISNFCSEEEVLNLVDRGMRCYFNSIANQLNGEIFPNINSTDTLIQASLLSSTIANNPQLSNIEKLHYLVGMILEQQGGIIARDFITSQMSLSPVDNDYWYLLTLAFLHYLAGGYRIQAKTIVGNLDHAQSQTQSEVYTKALKDIKRLFSDQFDYDTESFFIQSPKISGLISQIRANRVANLADLGLNNEEEWLDRRDLKDPISISFWGKYLVELSKRGITTFTKEQINNDFDSWLRNDKDLLVLLPTGSGKTIIGELRTALMLASGKQVVWLLPMRSLVRQTQTEMNKAFNALGIPVQELPTTEDYFSVFADIAQNDPMVAITTPEKFLALIRANERVLEKIGLIVVDEAQNLFENRGYAIEASLFQASLNNPNCKFVFLSAMEDKASQLNEFYNRLRPSNSIAEIVSSNRPTRCSYGVFTSLCDKDKKQIPSFVCYPLTESLDNDLKLEPRLILLPKTKATKWLNNSDLIRNFIKNSQGSSLRSIIFVTRKDSAESRAMDYSKGKFTVKFSDEVIRDLSRIEVERGKPSPFLESFRHEIAPHHGSLPKVEQIFIEKWIKKGFLKHIIATPTLAQGVNLPFDISIITFLSRFERGSSNSLSQAEVMNMLGRAGRAGMVSDGLALIAQQNSHNGNNLQKILNDYKKWFFKSNKKVDGLIGLSRILINLLNDDFDPNNWTEELSGFDFNEAVSLITLMAKVIDQNPGSNFEDKFKDEINKYPSIYDLQKIVGTVGDAPAFFAGLLSPMIKKLSSYPPEIVNAMALTGLPPEYINYLFENLKGIGVGEIRQPLDFANDIVEQSLFKCSTRSWFVKLQELSYTTSFEFSEGFTVIKKWVKGTPWNDMASEFSQSFNNNLINTGTFLNTKIPQLSQFWGGLTICDKILFGSESHRFDFIQPFIRNGVNSKQKYIVLKEIGDSDRVLAHNISKYFDLADEDSITDMQRKIRQKLKRWKFKKEIIPIDLNLSELMSLNAILDDIYIP